ncbi:MAG: hypothetical protein DMG79_11465 [Acidobacteria bacterium]|nr:MAG: hypothetical protein DMG79_11465 [Acidobacteriota bacterium]
MKVTSAAIAVFTLILAIPALGRDKKHNNRAMIEKMEAVPCGAKERGLTGIGSVFASIGATHVDSDEKLCPQYMLRTDDMEYHIRPLDHKHPRILPVGQEGEFKISKDVMEMRIPDGDHKKRRYQVVAMKPIDHSATGDQETNTRYVPRKDYAEKPLDAKASAQKTTVKPSADSSSPHNNW